MKTNVDSFVDEMATNGFESETICWVDVTVIRSASDFYVRPIRFKKLVKHYENLKPTSRVTSVQKEHEMILYNRCYYYKGDKYARGRIKKIYNDLLEFDIFAIDYGFTEERVPIKYLRKCPPDLLDVPGLAYHCLLANCFPVDLDKGWTKRSTIAFKEYLLDGRARITVLGQTTRQLIINLMNADFDDISTLLAHYGYSDLGPQNSCISWRPLIVRKRYRFNFKKLHVDDKFRVRVLSGMSLKLFYVKEVNDCNKFVEKIDEITVSAQKQYNLLPHHLIEGTVVCVKNMEINRYDRAFIKRVTLLESKAVLHLVDWGKDEEFTIDRIKYMSREALLTPVTTIMCSAPENKSWVNGHKEFLKPGFEFYIKIKTLGYEFERENGVDIIPINEVEMEGATCLGFYDQINKPKEQNVTNFLQLFDENEPQNLNTQNILSVIEMEEESLEQLVAWIKGMGVKRTNINASYTFKVVEKFIENYKQYGRVITRTESGVPRKSKYDNSSTNVETEMPKEGAPRESLLGTTSSEDRAKNISEESLFSSRSEDD